MGKHSTKLPAATRELIKQNGFYASFVFESDQEFDYFIQRAERSGLDPLAKQIYPTRRNRGMVIVTSIDAYRLIAARSGQYAGSDDAIITPRAGTPPILKATVTVYRAVAGVRCPFTASAYWDEYVVKGNQGFMWGKMPHAMISKCAEALSLRKAFPEDLGGTYTDDEMQQSEDEERPSVTPLMEASYENTAPPSEPPPDDEPEPIPDDERAPHKPNLDPDQERYRTEFLKKAMHPKIPPADREKAGEWAKSNHTVEAWEKGLFQLGLKITAAEEAEKPVEPEVPLDQIGKESEAPTNANGEPLTEAQKRALFEPDPADPDGLSPHDRLQLDQMMIEIEDALEAIEQHLREHPSDKKGQRSFDTLRGFWENLETKMPDDVKRFHVDIMRLAGEVG